MDASGNKWKAIWNSKEFVETADNTNEFERFCELKKANGFDVAVGDEQSYFRSFYDEWLRFFGEITKHIGDSIKSVYEVGCGSGVNLYMFKNRLPLVKCGGCDYSVPMIKSAVSLTGGEDFKCCGADEITLTPRYDVVMAESVFQYFDSIDYAEKVLRNMIQKSAKLTYLGEIHNKEFEEELMDFRRKTITDYEERYRGLKKLFLSKEWIMNIASEYDKTVVFTGVDNPEYLNGKYEFNCYIVDKNDIRGMGKCKH